MKGGTKELKFNLYSVHLKSDRAEQREAVTEPLSLFHDGKWPFSINGVNRGL
jgi:hypothetical protein